MEKSYPTQSVIGNFENASLRRLELILARNQTRLVIGLIVLAIAVRALYLVQIAESPLYQQHLASNTDMDFFESWAHQVASGDILSRGVRPPIHNWHIDVAVAYEEKKLGELPSLTTEERTEIAKRHWSRWCPPEKFYQEPLYPYMLALIYSVFGDGKLLVFAIQSLIGVATVIVLFRSTAMMFGNLIALISAAMAFGSPPILMYDAVLLRECLIIFFTSCLIYSLSISMCTNRWWPTGAVVGLACLAKTHFILVLVAALVLCVFRRVPLRLKLKSVVGLIGCFLLTSLPTVIRNAAVGTALFSAPTGGYFTFIGANVPDYPGCGFFQSPTYSPTLINNSEESMAKAIILTIGTHEDLLSFAASLSSRVLTSLSWYEPPNNTSSYFYELHSSVLRRLPFRFELVAPLCAIGLVVSSRKPKSALPFLILILVNWSVLILFFRHRSVSSTDVIGNDPFRSDWYRLRSRPIANEALASVGDQYDGVLLDTMYCLLPPQL